MKLFPITLAISLAMASTLALASHHGTPPADGAKPMHDMGMGKGMMGGMGQGMMGGMDKMSPEQHQKKMDAMFAHMDANSDSSVTKAEFDAHHKAMMAQHAAMKEAKPEAEHKH